MTARITLPTVLGATTCGGAECVEPAIMLCARSIDGVFLPDASVVPVRVASAVAVVIRSVRARALHRDVLRFAQPLMAWRHESAARAGSDLDRRSRSSRIRCNPSVRDPRAQAHPPRARSSEVAVAAGKQDIPPNSYHSECKASPPDVGTDPDRSQR